MSSDIPRARDELYTVAEQIRAEGFEDHANDIERIVDELMWRDPPARRSAVQSAEVTPEMASRIRRYARRNPDMSLQDIAVRFGTNSGRVSESINHKR